MARSCLLSTRHVGVVLLCPGPSRGACIVQDKHTADVQVGTRCPRVMFVWGGRLGLSATPQQLILVGTCKTIRNTLKSPETNISYFPRNTGHLSKCPGWRGRSFVKWPVGTQRPEITQTFLIICQHGVLLPSSPTFAAVVASNPSECNFLGREVSLAPQGPVQPSSRDGGGQLVFAA